MGLFYLQLSLQPLLLWGVVLCCSTLLSVSEAFYFNNTPSACSRVCESEHCTDQANLRYGKYCGIGYTGCNGEAACDGLDSCCEAHDRCVGDGDLANYVSRNCSNRLMVCSDAWSKSNGTQFVGNTCGRTDVVTTIFHVMEFVILNGKGVLHPHWAYLIACGCTFLVHIFQ